MAYKDVKWVKLIKAAYDSRADSTYHTLLKNLGQTLFAQSLLRKQQAIVDEAQCKRTIDYRQTENYFKAVSDIVKVDSEDSPIAIITRLITLFKLVTSCHHSEEENLSVFVLHFFGLAADYPQNDNASKTSQIGQLLAKHSLKNESWDEKTLTQCKFQLIVCKSSCRLSEPSKKRVQVDSWQYDDVKLAFSASPFEAGNSSVNAKNFLS